jgi:hypothetical protein
MTLVVEGRTTRADPSVMICSALAVTFCQPSRAHQQLGDRKASAAGPEPVKHRPNLAACAVDAPGTANRRGVVVGFSLHQHMVSTLISRAAARLVA